MKVLIQEQTGRTGVGIASSLSLVPEFSVIMWNPNAKPIMDMFDESKPDIVMVGSDILKEEAFKIGLSRYPNVVSICLGEVSEPLVSPNLTINKNNNDKFPTIIFDGGVMLGKIGRPSVKEDLMSEVLCFTDYIEGNEEQVGILEFLCSTYNVKIFGNVHVNVPNYLGIASDQVKADALMSTKVYVCLDGSSFYDAAWLEKPTIKTFTNIFELNKQIKEALEVGDSYVNRAAVKNKTYFDLCSEVLGFLGLTSESEYLIERKGDLL
tara:strand:- start:1678 stop:2475 length:798 start_codon:yes stop_codon:yes gene_type:complete